MENTKIETFVVTLEPSGKEIAVKEGQTLLDAAIRHGIQIPYGCRKGNCSACKAKVIDGEYELMDRVSEYSLLSFERDEGYVLLCSTIAESDMTIEMEEEEEDGVTFFPVLDFEATITENEALTHEIHRLTMQISDSLPFAFRAGQYAEFYIPQLDDTRAYSMSQVGVHANELEFIIKRIPSGAGSNYMCDLVIGDTVCGSGPFGKMQLRSRNHDLILVAGGSGAAPIKALIEEIFQAPFSHHVTFYFGVRTKEDLFLMDLRNEYSEKYKNFHFIPCLSDERKENWSGDHGFLADVIAKKHEHLPNAHAYMCGPPIMIETTTNILYKLGLRADQMFSDEF